MTWVSLYLFSGTNLKLYNISVTPKVVKKVIRNLEPLLIPGSDRISVVVLKNCEPELSYILAKLVSKCLKESCFPDCWNVSPVASVFKNVWEMSTAKNYPPVNWFHLLIVGGDLLIILITITDNNCMTFLSPFNSFFPHTARLWNFLPIECFSLTYYLNGFKGYIHYKTIFCHKVALDAQLMNFFIWREINVSFSRYLDFCAFVKFDFRICDVIIGIAT